MGLYVKGMEMPKDGCWKTVRIYPDGTCAVPNWQGDCTLIKGAQAISVPPHGDLIEREAICLTDFEIAMCNGDYKELVKMLLEKIESAPTIVPAEDGK